MSVEKHVFDYILTGRPIEEVATTSVFPREDWSYDKQNDYTSADYQDWLEGKINQEADEVAAGIERLFQAAPRVLLGEQDEQGLAAAVEEAFNAFRALDDEAAVRARRILGFQERPLIFGETCRNLPEDVMSDLSRIGQLAFMALDGRCDQEKIDLAIHAFGITHGIENDEISAARMRQGINDGESPQGPL